MDDPKNLPLNWRIEDNSLYRKVQFKNFVEAFSFMTSVALEAEKLNHHPTLKNTYSVVEMWLTTHSAGDTITEKDYMLAENINNLF